MSEVLTMPPPTRSPDWDRWANPDPAAVADLRASLPPSGPHRAVADALAAFTQARDGQAPLAQAAQALAAVLTPPPADPHLHALALSTQVAVLVMSVKLRDAAERLADLEALLPRVTHPAVRALVLDRGPAQYARATAGPLASADILTEALATPGLAAGSPAWCILRLSRAHRFLVAEQFDRAREDLDQADRFLTPLVGAGVLSAYLRAMYLDQTGDDAGAVRLLEQVSQAGQLNPAWVLTQKIQALLGLRRFEEVQAALADLQAIAQRGAASVRTVDHLAAAAALIEGRLEDAATAARRALAEGPGGHSGMTARERHEWALRVLCSVELNGRRPDAARRVLAVLDPEHSDTTFSFERCRLAWLEGDLEGAAVQYRLARRRGGTYLRQSLEHTHELSAYDLFCIAERAGEQAAPPPAPAPPAERPAVTRPAGPVVFVGVSPAAHDVRRLVERFAPTDLPVLLSGETGTGKEVVARLLHELSPRRDQPFLAINCGGVADTLIESELFGHARGAFTGATAARTGLFEAAGKGTLLLDEFHAMSPHLQSALLRVLENHEVRPVGSNETRRIHARVLVATNQDLQQLVRDGRVRADLYYRVARLEVHLPPLRERKADLPVLVQHFLRPLYGQFEVAVGDDLLAALAAYDWPGNVRELKNELERIVVLAGTAKVLTADLFRRAAGPGAAEPAPPPGPAEVRPASEPDLPAGGLKNRVARRRALLALFSRYDRLTQADIVRWVGCAPNTARADLRDLLGEGLVRCVNPTPHPRTAYYVKA